MHSPQDISHILFYSFSLVLFGPALEQMLGKFKFILVYLFTGIVGNVFTYTIGANDLHLGASGALFGMLGLNVYIRFFRNDYIDPVINLLVSSNNVVCSVLTYLLHTVY